MLSQREKNFYSTDEDFVNAAALIGHFKDYKKSFEVAVTIQKKQKLNKFSLECMQKGPRCNHLLNILQNHKKCTLSFTL